jgi:hypothetical protein
MKLLTSVTSNALKGSVARSFGALFIALCGIAIVLNLIVPFNTRAASDIISLKPVAASYVKIADPDRNYGTASYLDVDAGSPTRSFIRFQVAGLGQNSVTQARLRLYVTSGSRKGGLKAFIAPNNWDESTITWNNQPALGQKVAELAPGPLVKGQWIELDLGQAITGDGTYSLGLTTDATDDIKFQTYTRREAPQIMLSTLSIPVVSTPTSTPTALPPTTTPAPVATATPTVEPTPVLPVRSYGVLQSQSQYYASDWKAGIRVRALEIGWDLYEPQDGVWNPNYIQQKKAEYQQMIDSGFQVVLDFGMQYPPSWIFQYPNSRFVNQYGDAYIGRPAENGVNAVFNQVMRDRQARYVRQVLADLGANFYAVRLGWGYFGELNYPAATYNGHTNSYWAYDAISQGQAAGLPAGMRPSPVRGWTPGTPSANHADAAAFINWYLDSMKNYHDWQIATVRSVYPGKLMMLYPSWGIRPGQLDAAIAVDLKGSTSPEINGEVQRGFDYARYVGGIADSNVVVYGTWLNASNSGDSSSDPVQWSPIHYLAWLAANNPYHLGVWGENAGRNSYTDMQRCFQQVQAYGLGGIMWAFEPDLYSNQFATIDQYAALIGQNQ